MSASAAARRKRTPNHPHVAPAARVAPAAEDITAAIALIEDAKTIALFCGAGCRGAEAELVKTSDRLKAPLTHTYRAQELLRLAAITIGRSDIALGAFYRRLSARAGKAKAVTATARKLAVLFYNSLRFGMAYHDPGATQCEERYRSRVIGNLQRRAKDFGFSHDELPSDPKLAVS